MRYGGGISCNIQRVTNLHLSNVHFVFRDIPALRAPAWVVIAQFNSLSVQARRGWGRRHLKGGARWLRPKIWQRTKCTFERCTFVPLEIWGGGVSRSGLLTHTVRLSCSETGVFLKRVFSENPFLDILETLEVLEFLENLQTVEKKGDSDHFLEILENLEIFRLAPVRFGSVRFGDGTVRAVPVFGSGGSFKDGVLVCFSTVSQRGRFRFRLGSWKTVPTVPVPRSVPAKTVPTVPVSGFRFGSWATLDFRDSRDSSSEKTLFVEKTPCSGPESWCPMTGACLMHGTSKALWRDEPLGY